MRVSENALTLTIESAGSGGLALSAVSTSGGRSKLDYTPNSAPVNRRLAGLPVSCLDDAYSYISGGVSIDSLDFPPLRAYHASKDNNLAGKGKSWGLPGKWTSRRF